MTVEGFAAAPDSSINKSYVVVVNDEDGNRHERVTFDSVGGLLIGRGWHCDLIVQDVLVDAEHARVLLDSTGELRVDDLDSLNGLQLTSAALEGGELQLGTSSLVFHRADAPVPPAQRPSRWNAVRGWIRNPLWPLLVLLPLVCIEVYFGTARELDAGVFVSSAFYTLLGCGVWALFWGVLSKLLRNNMQLAAHFSVICWGVVGASVLGELADYLGWQAQSMALGEFLSVGGGALWLFALGVITLGIATTLPSRRLFLVAALPAILLVFVVYGLPLLQDEEPQWAAPVMSVSYPPGWQWNDGDSLESFLAGSQTLFDQSAQRAAERLAELDRTE